MYRKRITALLLAAPLMLTGCSKAADTPGAQMPPTSGAQQTQGPTPGQDIDREAFFSSMAKGMQKAKTYTMTMRLERDGETMTMTGRGDITDPNRPKADMSMSGQQGGPVQVISDGEAVYVQLPAAGGKGKYVKMPIGALSQAGGQDMRQLTNPGAFLEVTKNAVEKVTYQGSEDKEGQKLQHYSCVLNPQRLQEGLMTGRPAPQPTSMPASMPYDVWLDSENRVRKTTMNIDGATMTMTVDKYGEPVSIAAPPASEVTQMPGLSTSAPTASPTTVG